MQIDQVVIDFHSVPDRLLLSLYTEGTCIRIWLTRRYVGLLRTALADILRIELTVKQPLALGSEVLLAELEHERAMASFDISVLAATGPTDHAKPLCTSNTQGLEDNSDAWLAFGLQILGNDSNPKLPRASALTITPQEGEGVTLNLTNDLPHVLVQMLSQACEAAEWGVDFTALGACARTTSSEAIGSALH